MSPYADLTLAGTTIETRREVDPLLSREALQARVPDYTSGQDAALGLISPIFADLSGLPPLIIQAGTHEVLLDDALRLARHAATADVEVTLDITPRVPHVFQAYTRSSTKGPRRWTEPDIRVGASRRCRARRRASAERSDMADNWNDKTIAEFRANGAASAAPSKARPSSSSTTAAARADASTSPR